jgi:GIY-YIG catalytic domain
MTEPMDAPEPADGTAPVDHAESAPADDETAGPPDDAAAGPPDDAAAGPPAWQEREAWQALDDLDVSPALVPASEWPAGAEGLDRPGLFGFWVDEAGAADLARGLDLPLEAGRIWMGQAGATRWPSGRANGDTLGDRIARTHLMGRVRSSSIRLTLASILFVQLDLVVQASALLQASAEQDLSDWMSAHLSIAVHPHDDRDSLAGLEQAMLQRLDPPLNIEGHLQATSVRQSVMALRRRISREG